MTLITDAEWDILVILDACRYDYFQQQNTIPGALTSQHVDSSYTIEYMKTYFPDTYPITYVSANPLVNSKMPLFGYNAPEHFAEIIDVWQFGWDPDLDSVPPSTVTKAALPHLADPRVVVHYIQPHVPYIGATRFPAPATNWAPDFAVLEHLHEMMPLPVVVYTQEQTQTWRRAYRDNLQLALPAVKDLVDCAPPNRRIVVSADHGELLGEDGLKYHPGIRHPLLNTVPWLRIQT